MRQRDNLRIQPVNHSMQGDCVIHIRIDRGIMLQQLATVLLQIYNCIAVG